MSWGSRPGQARQGKGTDTHRSWDESCARDPRNPHSAQNKWAAAPTQTSQHTHTFPPQFPPPEQCNECLPQTAVHTITGPRNTRHLQIYPLEVVSIAARADVRLLVHWPRAETGLRPLPPPASRLLLLGPGWLAWTAVAYLLGIIYLVKLVVAARRPFFVPLARIITDIIAHSVSPG